MKHMAVGAGLFLFVGLAGWPAGSAGADASAGAAGWISGQKPAWLTELSAGVKESYDDNVFLSGVDSKYLPPAYAVPPGSVAALKNRWSWVTTFTPKLGVNFAPLLGDRTTLQTLSLMYAPEFGIYHEQPSEDYGAHRFVTAVKAGTGALSLGLDDTFAYVNGSKLAPVYPGGYVTAYNVGAPRERRAQIQDRASVALQYDRDQWFVRPTAALLYYDMMTELLNNATVYPGYQDYESRYDVNGGLDVGYKIIPQLAVTAGYRYGHQYQQQFDFSPYSAPSDYQRALLGLEGRPWKWLELKIQGGPDFRDYAGDSAGHITPVGNKHMITYYGEASLTATISPRDTLAFRYKQWQWVSSVGRVPYFDGTYDLNYHRQLTDKLGLDLGGRLLTADYTSGNLVPGSLRDDWQYTVSAGLGYAFNAHASVNLAYCLDLGRNAQDGIADPSTRDYNHQLTSLGAVFKF